MKKLTKYLMMKLCLVSALLGFFTHVKRQKSSKASLAIENQNSSSAGNQSAKKVSNSAAKAEVKGEKNSRNPTVEHNKFMPSWNDMKQSYLDLDDAEIEQKLVDLKFVLESEQFIQRANEGSLDPESRKDFERILTQLDVLGVIKVERMLSKLELWAHENI